MKLKKVVAGVLGAGLVMSLGTGSMKVSAEDEGENGTEDNKVQSEVNVQFTAPKEGGTEIRDPNNPEQTLDNAGDFGKVTGDKGLLALEYVSHISFGDVTIKPSKMVIDSVTTAPFIQVSDLRGTGAGWKVNAKLNDFQEVNEEGETQSEKSLTGASITLSNGTALSTDKENKPSEEQTPGVNENIRLSSGASEEKVVEADAKDEQGTIDTAQGVGTWLTRWLGDDNGKNGNVTLEVPARSASVGNHKAVIDWVLTNGPGSD